MGRYEEIWGDVGARQSVQETIISAYAGDKLEDKQLAGEDYWVDPAELKREVDAQRNARSRLKQYKRKESSKSAFKTAKLRREIAAPYKNNVISYVVAGFGVAALLFNVFPRLLELPEIADVKFPDVL